MRALLKACNRGYDEREGVTSIEYALIAALIAVVIMVAVASVGTAVNNLFTIVVDAFKDI